MVSRPHAPPDQSEQPGARLSVLLKLSHMTLASLQPNLGIINIELQFLKLTAPEVLWAFLGYAFLSLHAKRS